MTGLVKEPCCAGCAGVAVITEALVVITDAELRGIVLVITLLTGMVVPMVIIFSTLPVDWMTLDGDSIFVDSPATLTAGGGMAILRLASRCALSVSGSCLECCSSSKTELTL